MRYASLEVIEEHVKYLVDFYCNERADDHDDQLLLNRNAQKSFSESLRNTTCVLKPRTVSTVAILMDRWRRLSRPR